MFPEAVALPDPRHPPVAGQPPPWRGEPVEVLAFMLYPERSPAHEPLIQQIPYRLRFELQLLYAAAQYHIRCYRRIAHLYTIEDVNFNAPTVYALHGVFRRVSEYRQRCLFDTTLSIPENSALEAQAERDAALCIAAYAPWAPHALHTMLGLRRALAHAGDYLFFFMRLRCQKFRTREDNTRVLPLAMAHHERLGCNSPLRNMPPDVMQRVVEDVRFDLTSELPQIASFLYEP